MCSYTTDSTSGFCNCNRIDNIEAPIPEYIKCPKCGRYGIPQVWMGILPPSCIFCWYQSEPWIKVY